MGSVLLGICSYFMALAGTFMVDPLAAVIAVVSIVMLASLRPGAGRKRMLAATLLCVMTLLTKYNIRMPLIPTAFVLAGLWFAKGEKRLAASLILIGLL